VEAEEREDISQVEGSQRLLRISTRIYKEYKGKSFLMDLYCGGWVGNRSHLSLLPH